VNDSGKREVAETGFLSVFENKKTVLRKPWRDFQHTRNVQIVTKWHKRDWCKK
ncbi:unnamed protein product, partial [Caretta caretta]